MGEVSGFHIGQTVELHDGRIAAVRFAGTTHFAPGDWLGVELEDNSGKNDGSLQGQRYFDCEPGYGMFVRPGVATVLEETTSQPVDRRANGSTEKLPEKPGSKNVTGGLRRQTVGGIANGKRASINTGSSMPSGRAVGALGVLRVSLAWELGGYHLKPYSLRANHPRSNYPQDRFRGLHPELEHHEIQFLQQPLHPVYQFRTLEAVWVVSSPWAHLNRQSILGHHAYQR